MSARLLFNKEIATVLHLINWQSHFMGIPMKPIGIPN